MLYTNHVDTPFQEGNSHYWYRLCCKSVHLVWFWLGLCVLIVIDSSMRQMGRPDIWVVAGFLVRATNPVAWVHICFAFVLAIECMVDSRLRPIETNQHFRPMFWSGDKNIMQWLRPLFWSSEWRNVTYPWWKLKRSASQRKQLIVFFQRGKESCCMDCLGPGSTLLEAIPLVNKVELDSVQNTFYSRHVSSAVPIGITKTNFFVKANNPILYCILSKALSSWSTHTYALN